MKNVLCWETTRYVVVPIHGSPRVDMVDSVEATLCRIRLVAGVQHLPEHFAMFFSFGGRD
jgi:hypothetical protein